jgi:hypothetical protein
MTILYEFENFYLIINFLPWYENIYLSLKLGVEKLSSVPNTLFSINVTMVDNKSPFFAHTPVVYFPYYTIIEFIGYLGWIKVAETLLNPWGDDDEDFQINYLIDRNFQVTERVLETDFSFSKTNSVIAYTSFVPALAVWCSQVVLFKTCLGANSRLRSA